MKQKLLFLAIGLFINSITYGQTTYSPRVASTNVPNCTISKIEILGGKTYVYLIYEKTKSNMYQAWIAIGSSTYIKDRLTGTAYQILGLGDNLLLNTQYSTTDKKGTKYNLTLIFPAIPPGTTLIDIIEFNGFQWNGISITNPDNSISSDWNEVSLKIDWEKNGLDILEGIYENTNSEKIDNKYKLALKRKAENYELIFLSGNDNGKWNVGDIKAILNKTASPNLFKVKWYLADKSISEDLYITFDAGLMKIIWTDGQPESLYLKLYPTSSSNITGTASGVKSSGTGFAISSDGYIVTNYHVVEGANKISIRGVKGNFSRIYSAEIVVVDKNNDLAIVRINDPDFTTLGIIPYTITNTIADVGNSVYALGYPLRATMGDEVKLTNGIISSKTGFQGDITTYQVSVPLQPGNSGGPLFNSEGNVIGIVNAKHVGTENVSYAIKTNYLINLIQVMNTTPVLPKLNTISTKGLSEQVKFVKEYVYILEIN